jgi:peptide/nickel transport system substrate-binding protein
MTQSRREFLRMSAMVGAATVAAACTPAQPDAPAPVVEPTTAPAAPSPGDPISRYNEAPMLADMVARGDLPSVHERLPENPYVVEGLDGIGNYGGTWRMQKSGQADGYARFQVLTRGLTTIDHTMMLKTYFAESFETNSEATEWTFHLRKGVKWSDGEPITAEDFRFWYEDLILDRRYTISHPNWLASIVDGDVVPAEFSAPDDFTIKYKFALPAGLFAYDINIVLTVGVMAPAHFLKRFHPDYGDKAEIDALLAGNTSWDDWTQLLADKNNANVTIERPTHEPWVNRSLWTDEVIKLERNPYFWEADTAGNQLPYIDYLQYREFQGSEVAVLRTINGETDCQARHLFGFANYTVFKENEAKCDYTVQLWRGTRVHAIMFNMTTRDQRVADLFRERDFRIAVSLCANRDEMRELVDDGFGRNTQYCPPPDSPYYYEKLATAYIDYDPDRTNALLDGLGYTERDAEGYRLWKGGSRERISFTCLGGPEMGPVPLLMTDYLRDVGLAMNYRGGDRSLTQQLTASNEVEVVIGIHDRNLVPLADPQIWVKNTGPAERPMFAAWSTWYVDPSSPIAERPPEGHWIWDIWAAWEDLQRAVGDEAQKEAWFRIMDVWAEELPSPAFYGDIPIICIVKNGFKGIHEGYGWDCCTTVYEHIIDNATWYWEEPSKHIVY